jgi:hypothetical protein
MGLSAVMGLTLMIYKGLEDSEMRFESSRSEKNEKENELIEIKGEQQQQQQQQQRTGTKERELTRDKHTDRNGKNA